MKKLDKKSRYWGFIIYPNDIHKNWLDDLINLNLKFCLSPLHDCDVWDESSYNRKKDYCDENGIKIGDSKKAHYHCMICYPNTTTEKCILQILKFLDIGVNYVEPINSVIGQYEYFTHKYNDNKHKYDETDIKAYNGFNINDYYELSSKETLMLKKCILLFIKTNKIYHYDDLVNFLMDNEMDDELSIVMTNTIFFNNYLRAKKDKHNIIKKD